MTSPRIYLDNAATTWPKPETVYQAVDRYQRDIGAAAGRGSYHDALRAGQIVARTRASIRRLVAAPTDAEVIFTFNGTDALNLCLHGLLREKDHVVTSEAEHNSVLRPLRTLQERLGLEVDFARCDSDGIVSADSLQAATTGKTKLIALTHASNVTGAVQPIEAAAEIAHRHGALLLVDAAQTLGHFPLNLSSSPVDLLATSGHKGLLGPLGTGIAVLRASVCERLNSFRQGGTGTVSESSAQPTSAPDKFESGNLNMPGIAGLEAGLEFVRGQGASIREHEIALSNRLVAHLSEMPQVVLYGPQESARRVGVVSFTMRGYDCQELAAMLDAAGGVQVRAGLHCAPQMHRRLGTLTGGGTVRASFGPFNTLDDVACLCDLLRSLLNS